MPLSQIHQEVNLQLASASSLQLAFQQIERDLCFSPFSDEDTAKILGVQTCDLPFLYEHNILERTCLPTEIAFPVHPACSYWDMFNGTICMSLLAAGVSIQAAQEIAFRLCDVIAEHGEQETDAAVLDYTKLLSFVEWLLTEDESGFDLRRSLHPVQAVAKKVVVDLLHMHQRCLSVRSPVFGWRQ